MGDPAKNLEDNSVSVDGLEDVFRTEDKCVLGGERSQDIFVPAPETKEDTEDIDVLSVEEVSKDTKEDWTVKEAAIELNCSEKTILRKLRNGKLPGYKVQGEKTLEWRVRRESQDTDSIEIDPTQDNTTQNQGTLEDKNNVLIEELRGQVEHLESQLQASIYRQGFLEGKLEDRNDQIKLLPDLEARAREAEKKELERKEEIQKIEEQRHIEKNNSDEQIEKLKEELAQYKALEERSVWKKFGDWMLGKHNVS